MTMDCFGLCRLCAGGSHSTGSDVESDEDAQTNADLSVAMVDRTISIQVEEKTEKYLKVPTELNGELPTESKGEELAELQNEVAVELEDEIPAEFYHEAPTLCVRRDGVPTIRGALPSFRDTSGHATSGIDITCGHTTSGIDVAAGHTTSGIDMMAVTGRYVTDDEDQTAPLIQIVAEKVTPAAGKGTTTDAGDVSASDKDKTIDQNASAAGKARDADGNVRDSGKYSADIGDIKTFQKAHIYETAASEAAAADKANTEKRPVKELAGEPSVTEANNSDSVEEFKTLISQKHLCDTTSVKERLTDGEITNWRSKPPSVPHPRHEGDKQTAEEEQQRGNAALKPSTHTSGNLTKDHVSTGVRSIDTDLLDVVESIDQHLINSLLERRPDNPSAAAGDSLIHGGAVSNQPAYHSTAVAVANTVDAMTHAAGAVADAHEVAGRNSFHGHDVWVTFIPTASRAVMTVAKTAAVTEPQERLASVLERLETTETICSDPDSTETIESNLGTSETDGSNVGTPASFGSNVGTMGSLTGDEVNSKGAHESNADTPGTESDSSCSDEMPGDEPDDVI